MRGNTVIALVAVGAVLIGTLAVCASGALLGELNPDPYEHSGSYVLDGTVDSVPCTGTARLVTIHENASFHDYCVDGELGPAGEQSRTFRFHLIFDTGGIPVGMHDSGTEDIGGRHCRTWSGTLDGASVTISVDDRLMLHAFTYSRDGIDCRGETN